MSYLYVISLLAYHFQRSWRGFGGPYPRLSRSVYHPCAICQKQCAARLAISYLLRSFCVHTAGSSHDTYPTSCCSCDFVLLSLEIGHGGSLGGKGTGKRFAEELIDSLSWTSIRSCWRVATVAAWMPIGRHCDVWPSSEAP